MKNSLYQSLLSRLKNKHTKLASRFHKSVRDGEFQKQHYRKRKESIDRLKNIEKRISKIGREAGLKPNLNYRHWAVALAMGVVVSASAQQKGEKNFQERLKQLANKEINGIQPLAQSIFYEPKVGLGAPVFNEFHTGDLDGDGDIDGVYASYFDSPLLLFNDGGFSFNIVPLTNVPLEIVNSTILADFDGDGDLDLLMENGPYENFTEQIWINDGSGNFTSQAAFFPNVDLVDDKLFPADIDGDGDLDIISQTQQDTPFRNFVTVFRNTAFDFNDSTAYKGSYIFSPSSSLMNVMDVDGDTDMDIVFTSVVPSFSNYGIQILENDGSGNLSQPSTYLAPSSGFYYGTVALDFDNDGDLDMVGLADAPNIRAIPFSSNGTIPNDGSSPFTEEAVVPLTLIGEREGIFPAEIDNNNFDDFVAITRDSTFVIISNGDGTFTEQTKFAGQSKPEDLDGDGDADLFYFDGNVSIRDNQGGGTFNQQADLLTISATYDTQIIDLDGDGDLDLAQGGVTISRTWLNNGNGEFTLNQEFPGGAYQLAFGDLDGDSDLDMVVAIEEDGGYPGFVIYTNNGSGNMTYNSNIGGGVYETKQIVLADMDEDGDLDIVARQQGSTLRYITIYDNQGSLTFSPVSSYNNPNGEKMALANIDADTDSDIIIALDNLGFASIINNSGSLTTGASFLPSGPNFEITDVDLADFDSDGDMDVFATNGYESITGNSYVFLNDGAGAFTQTAQNLETGITYSSFVGDLDSDGDIDIISGGYISYPRVWVNDGSANFALDQYLPALSTEYSKINIGDLDGDSDADLIASDYYGGTNIFFNSGNAGPGPLGPDSTALVNIFDSMGGTGWTTNTNWKSGNVSTWHGVFLNNDGDRVERLELPNNGLTGTLPAAIDQLDALVNLDLSGNQIDALATDFSTLTNAVDINLNSNRLDFGDLEPVAGVAVLSYTTQAPVEAIDQTGPIEIPVGSIQELTANAAGTANSYQWIYNGQAIGGATGTTYLIENINRSNMGEYSLEISNSIATGVTLTAVPLEVLATAVITINVTDDTDTPISQTVDGYILEIEEGVVGFDTVEVATQTGVASSFSFPPVVLGDFLVNVSSDETLYIPTYYGDAFVWDEADTLRLNTDTTRQIEITEIPEELTPDDGEGLVEGVIEEDFDDNARIDARRRASKRKCGLRRKRTGGRTDQDDEFVLIAYGETDENGEFAYGFLPQGTYRFFVEYPGIPLDDSAFVQFDVGEAGVSDNTFQLAVFASDDGIFIELVLGLTSPHFTEFAIFPNPTADLINIRYDQIKSGELTLEIFDLKGKEMMKKTFNSKREDITIDISDFDKGQYIFRVIDSTSKDLVIYKIIKN